jgi:hypothetical protein
VRGAARSCWPAGRDDGAGPGLAPAKDRHQALKRGQLDDLRAQPARPRLHKTREAQIAELLAVDLELNAQGMAIWLDRLDVRRGRWQQQQPAPGGVHFGLGGRVVVITGARRASARPAPGAGPRRRGVALWDVADGPARQSPPTCRPQGAQALYCHCNVAHKAEVDAALAATLARFGHVDGLVNNAGIFKAANFLDITEADWDAVIAVNLKGSFLVGQAVARAMLRQQANKGAIVNMSSVNGTLAIPSIASYNASKGASTSSPA